ncbi:hypothetical protein [Streptomyces broussonetiae]|uniref:hypothetical protein n=1 Tax=Streptomyces broussonetiae TaxID=2686304 RepID=UPI0035DE7D7B
MVQTTLVGVFFVTLRLSFPLVAGISLLSAWHPMDVPTRLLGLLTATVLVDRSAVTYLRVRRS